MRKLTGYAKEQENTCDEPGEKIEQLLRATCRDRARRTSYLTLSSHHVTQRALRIILAMSSLEQAF